MNTLNANQIVNAENQQTTIVKPCRPAHTRRMLRAMGENLREWATNNAQSSSEGFITKLHYLCVRDLGLKIRRDMERKDNCVNVARATECGLMHSLANSVKYRLVKDGTFKYNNTTYKVTRAAQV
jgi:hypothetical protein